MRKVLDRSLPPSDADPPAAGGDARRLRGLVAEFVRRAAAGTLVLHCPGASAPLARGAGHFHLAPELFLQVAGHTEFRLPNARLQLAAGEALLLPPKLLHDEHVGAPPGEDFCNVVVYAEGGSLSCHLAHEVQPGRPGIRHLESRRHPEASRVCHWLVDAVRLAEGDPAQPWAGLQVRALVAAAAAGVLRLLDEARGTGPDEPDLVARVRVLVQNRLADHRLSVRGLAEQCDCTADYLSHVFSRSSGEHLVAYINRQRMERARHLLRDATLAGKEVAWACGFATQSYFIRIFREHHGTTPAAWRAAHRSG